MPIPWLAADVREIVVETPDVKTIRLAVPGWRGHVPGQHVDVRLTAEDGYQAQRSYSIASPPEEDGVALTVERLEDGEVSTFLTEELRAGDRLELRGPLGGYFTWTVEQGGPLALVAGGSGIVPLMAMLRHRAAQASNVPTRLLCSWRAAEQMIYRDELARLAARRDGLEVTHTLTRDATADWRGHSRRIDREMLLEALPGPEARPLAYVCGPTPMVESVATLLVSLGHAPERIRTERFGPTGGG
ncbi:ferredoxin reductase [Anaeromyxobacter oryzae]|uniref:Oxidoreductase n=1 Tax=Anaeromyxobacter oryzae TaxID=2918170 RepID=A0ABM7WZ39_9BACT|nr:ferredoxin reductase [Anaeromyxobacter oryzae]BDG04741.1 oxidoreductase [Anaeromyxobacter oryzae]